VDYAAAHPAIQQEADAAEHFSLSESLSAGEKLPDALRQSFVVRHKSARDGGRHSLAGRHRLKGGKLRIDVIPGCSALGEYHNLRFEHFQVI